MGQMSLTMKSRGGAPLQAFWALLGNGSYAAAKWGMLLILTRLTDPATVGQFALAFAISAPVMMLTDMRLQFLLAADAHDDHRFSDYLRARASLSTLAFLAIVGFAFFAFGPGRFFLIVALVTFAKWVESFGDIVNGLYLKHRSVRRMAISLGLKAALSLALFLGAILWTGDVVVACLSMSIAYLLPLAFYDVPVAARLLGGARALFGLGRDAPSQVGRPAMLRLIRSSAVLGLVALLGSLFSNVANYVIGSHLGDAQLGIYAAIAYFGVGARLVATSMIQPAIPRLAAAYRGGDRAGFRKSYKSMLTLALTLGLLGILFAVAVGQPFLVLVYGPSFADKNSLFILTMVSVAAFHFVQFHWIIFTAMRHLNVQLLLSAMTIVLMLAFALFLTPRFGVPGAVYSEIAAFGAFALSAIWVVLTRSRAE